MPLDAVPAKMAPSCLIAGYVSTGMEQVCNCAKACILGFYFGFLLLEANSGPGESLRHM